MVALDSAGIDAVVFDIGGVFLIPNHTRIGDVLAAVGLATVEDHDLLVQAHYRGVRAMTEHHAREVVGELDAGLWVSYDTAYFATLGVPPDRLPAAAEARAHQRRRRVEGVWTYPLRHNIAAVASFAAAYALAVVSNNDGTAEAQCVEFGIGQVGEGPLPTLAAVVDSTVVGRVKPDPEIFAPALAALGTEPSRTLYVGDTVYADVVGAANAGMQVVQLDPLDLHADHDHARCADLPALASLLLSTLA